VYFEGGGIALRDDLPEPTRGPGECRVQVLCAGVCATDLALARGYMGFQGIPGHEFVGLALDGPHEGQRVVGEINAGCGSCPRCESGDPRHCSGRSVLGILRRPGAFAEQLVLPAANLLPVPDEVSTSAATFTEPLAAAFEILEQLEPAAGTEALVIGDGRLGLLCAQALHHAGLEVSLEGRHPERSSFLPSGLSYVQPEAGERWPLVVEATGHPEGVKGALARTSPRGTVVLKTTTEAPVSIDLAPLVVDEIRLVGSRCGRFAPALAALAEGKVAVEPMISARYPLSRAEDALEAAARRGALKVLIDVSDAPPPRESVS